MNAECSMSKNFKLILPVSFYICKCLHFRFFPDVPVALESWSKLRKVAIYSNGNVLGQQCVFTHSADGDFSSHIHRYFDETIGGKTETGSYEKISNELNVKPEEIVFITDLIDG